MSLPRPLLITAIILLVVILVFVPELLLDIVLEILEILFEVFEFIFELTEYAVEAALEGVMHLPAHTAEILTFWIVVSFYGYWGYRLLRWLWEWAQHASVSWELWYKSQKEALRLSWISAPWPRKISIIASGLLVLGILIVLI